MGSHSLKAGCPGPGPGSLRRSGPSVQCRESSQLTVFLVESPDLALGQLEGRRGCSVSFIYVVTGVAVTGESLQAPTTTHIHSRP